MSKSISRLFMLATSVALLAACVEETTYYQPAPVVVQPRHRGHHRPNAVVPSYTYSDNNPPVVVQPSRNAAPAVITGNSRPAVVAPAPVYAPPPATVVTAQPADDARPVVVN